jgi:hypothetical protein
VPNWGEILDDVKRSGHTTDMIRRRYMGKSLSAHKTKYNHLLFWLPSKTEPGRPGAGLWPQ